MVLPVHRLINGLTRPQVDQWFVRLGCKSPTVFKDFWIPTLGRITDFRCTLSADVVRINRTLLCSRWCEQRLARRDAHTDELLVLLVEYPVILLERTSCFGSRCLFFRLGFLGCTRLVHSLSVPSREIGCCHHHRKRSW